jgi:hypothetical protein
MRRFVRAAVALLLMAASAFAQNTTPPPYPQGAIAVGKSVAGTTGTVAPALPAKSGYTTFVCNFVITSGGTSSQAVVTTTLSGLSANFIDSSTANQLSYQYVFPSTGQGLLGIAWPNCIPAAAANSAITLTVPGGGAGTNVEAGLTGYQMPGTSQ